MPFVDTNGLRMHYDERGGGEPLVLIMGLGAPGSLWEDHVQAFEQHFRCILLDNRGAGESDKPEGPYTTAMMAEDVAGVIQALDLGPARVAGISMGSGIAQELALSHPELVRSLLLIASWARCDHYTAAVFEHFRHMRALASPPEFVQLLQLWIFTAGYYEQHYTDLVQGQQGAAEGYMPLHAFCAQADACATHDTLDRLSQITAPALLTCGSADIFTPLRLSLEMLERLPNADLLVLPGVGHCHHWEDLVTFNTETTKFLLGH